MVALNPTVMFLLMISFASINQSLIISPFQWALNRTHCLSSYSSLVNLQFNLISKQQKASYDIMNYGKF